MKMESRERVARMLVEMLVMVWLRVTYGAGVDARIWGPSHGKFSGVIIPGFASTRLRAWSLLDCPFSPLDFNPLDPVWLDTKKVLSVPNCWMKCMMLDAINQTDHPECKSRPDSGVAAISELDPGYITGALSSVWKEWVSWCVEFGIEADAIVAAPYDWRLAGPVLEERDLYFHRLRLTFETCRKHRGGPSLVFAHSLGNNVFRYFLEWLKLEIPPKLYQTWIDDHIFAYHALGAPFLGAGETAKAFLSGLTFGLPISEGTSRMMLATFSSSLWMLPFSHNCHANQKKSKKKQANDDMDEVDDDVEVAENVLLCNEKEFTVSSSGWPLDIIKVEMPMTAGVSYPGVVMEKEALAAIGDCTVPIQRSYSAHKIADGTMFKEIGDFDPEANVLLQQLHKFYLNDPIFNPFTPWERPPIKNVFCMYGVNLKTEVSYQLAPSGKLYPDNWFIKDIAYEIEGGALMSRSGASVEGNPSIASGDSTVPYNSLSWCKTWLGSKINVTRAPQNAHDGTDVERMVNVENDDKAVTNMRRDSRVKYVTYHEDSTSLPGKKTAVWEFDKLDHRNLVRSPVVLRELWLEILHGSHPQATRSFVSKGKREPMRDSDCFWDYSKARCALIERCEYRYVFGDVHLGQSCRLKASSDKHILHYL